MSVVSNSFRLIKASVFAGFVFTLAVSLADKLTMDVIGLESGLSAAFAQSKPKPKPRKLPGISDKFFKQMGKVQPLISPNTGRKPRC